MKEMIKLFIIISMFGFLMSGIAQAFADNNSTHYQASTTQNQALKFKISKKLNDTFPGDNIEVAVFNDQVLLTGQVSSVASKIAADSIVSNFAPKQEIANYLTISKPQSATSTAKDIYITNKVKSKLMLISGVDSGNIKVVTTNGIVYLMGEVSSEQATLIVNKTKQVDGVKKVIDLLTVF
jgi:osmotically-inducible protein OsmY